MLVRLLVIVTLVFQGAGLWSAQPCPDEGCPDGAQVAACVAPPEKPSCCDEACEDCPLCNASRSRPCPMGRAPEAPAPRLERATFLAILTVPPVVIGEMTRPAGPLSLRPDTRSAVRAPARAALCVWLT